MVQVILPPPKEDHEQMSERDFAPFMEPVPTEERPTAAQRAKPQRVNRASALTAGLDAELRADAEVAVQEFRSKL